MDFKKLLPTHAAFYNCKVTMQDMEDALKAVEAEGYKNAKVVMCPQFKEPRF